ncbi:heme exporter protein CcmD [Acuticoccus sp. M5D2P5]|uniref:heme exporter protein CcmD n=1 Tax=Acuticoccus kalidii TaxID=2910977 RepID=UPI001F1C014F|nr:heme exporter protein CcmD [Acuticoccus kalidii]MCF3936042.1 heme exporter protein CcmD [Acuticoccus kalidii]
MGQYAGYVIAAYAITFGTIAALVLWAVVDRRMARAALARAERATTRLAGDGIVSARENENAL